MLRKFYSILALITVISLLFTINTSTVKADDGINWISPYYGEKIIQTEDGPVTMHLIGGSPVPPDGYDQNESYDMSQSDEPIVMLEDFPSYSWVFGCGAVSAGMIAAWYDRNGYPNVYTGPTNNDTVPVTYVAQKSL
jgi:hypothetical protein